MGTEELERGSGWPSSVEGGGTEGLSGGVPGGQLPRPSMLGGQTGLAPSGDCPPSSAESLPVSGEVLVPVDSGGDDAALSAEEREEAQGYLSDEALGRPRPSLSGEEAPVQWLLRGRQRLHPDPRPPCRQPQRTPGALDLRRRAGGAALGQFHRPPLGPEGHHP